MDGEGGERLEEEGIGDTRSWVGEAKAGMGEVVGESMGR